jgi:hypothetical protein
MSGYVIRVDELCKPKTVDDGHDLIFIDPMETKSSYPIPSAFAAYADYMEMKRGISEEE